MDKSNSKEKKGPKLLNYKNLLFDKYEYNQPFKTQNGTYLSICNYRLSRSEQVPFFIETPKLKTVSGIIKLENKFYIDLELSHSGDVGLFYNFLLKNDENNISICHENSEEWFGQRMPLNVIQQCYKTPIILKSGGQLPVIRMHIPSYKGNIMCEIYNHKKELINDFSCINENDVVVMIVEFGGIMFSSQTFVPYYEVQKIKIFKDKDERNLPSGYLFSDLDEKINIDLNSISNGDSNGIVNIEGKEHNLNKTEKVENKVEKKDNKNQLQNKGKEKVEKMSTKSLFELIKENGFKDIINDKELKLKENFKINNSEKKQVITIPDLKPVSEPVVNDTQVTELPVGINDFDKIQDKLLENIEDMNANLNDNNDNSVGEDSLDNYEVEEEYDFNLVDDDEDNLDNELDLETLNDLEIVHF